MTAAPTGALERALRQKRDGGSKLVAAYVTGGLGAHWLDVVRALVAAGADTVEVGLPFSDPIIDGPTIQEASTRALGLGATPMGVLAELSKLDPEVPTAVMTYYNLICHNGLERMAAWMVEAGVAASIVPDLPLEEVGDWAAVADGAGIETVMLAAPSTPEDRLAPICRRSRGFVYGVAVMGVTGERSELSASARQMAKRLKSVTDLPVLIGIGISGPEQARQVCEEADGVVVGSAIVRRVLEGGPEAAGEFMSELRDGLDR